MLIIVETVLTWGNNIPFDSILVRLDGACKTLEGILTAESESIIECDYYKESCTLNSLQASLKFPRGINC